MRVWQVVCRVLQAWTFLLMPQATMPPVTPLQGASRKREGMSPKEPLAYTCHDQPWTSWNLTQQGECV
eukprot:1146952-Pelagomonas_calceolata.AAC.2